MAYPQDWDAVENKLNELYPSDLERGRVRKKLLEVDEAKALKYFRTSDAAVKATLDEFLREGNGAGATKTVYIAQLADDATAANFVRQKFKSHAGLQQYLTRGGIAALIDVTEGSCGDGVTDFDDLMDGHKYMQQVPGFVQRVQEVRSAQVHYSKAHEFELALSIRNECLRARVLSKPVIRDDLRLLDGLELDAVVMGSNARAVIGEHKLYTRAKRDLEEWFERMQALRDGIRKGDQAYAAFQGRRLGLAFMTEYLDPAARSSVPAFCRKHGIALFRRNGCDIHVARPGMVPGRGLVQFV